MEVRPKIHVLQDQFGRVIAVRFSYGIGVFVKYVRNNQKNTEKYAEALVNGQILYIQEALRKAKRILLFLDNIEDCIVKFDEQCISTQDAFDTLIFLLGNLISEKLEIDETADIVCHEEVCEDSYSYTNHPLKRLGSDSLHLEDKRFVSL